MRKILLLPALIMMTRGAMADVIDLNVALNNARTACSGISDKMGHLKTMAGINTAVTSVGAVAGGAAVASGVAKAKVDEAWRQQRALLEKLEKDMIAQGEEFKKLNPSEADIKKTVDEAMLTMKLRNGAQKQMSMSEAHDKVTADAQVLDKASKTLGNIRTGTLAANTATNIAGAAIAGTNMVDDDLQSKIDACVASIKTLSESAMQARIENPNNPQIANANNIVTACSDWDGVNLSAINKRAKGAAITSGIGAGIGAVGTIASAVANTDKVRTGDETQAKNVNTAANVMAGGATAASVVATIFNATQISAIKRAAAVADKCEEVL